MKKLLLLILSVGFLACSQQKAPIGKTLAEQVDAFIESDQYMDALTLLSAKDETPEILKLKEKTHLNYGLFLEYRDSNTTNMRDKMNSALLQYVEVLKLNVENEKAISEIDQIMGIYSTFPNRTPDEEVMKELQALGFEY
tara:strand:- start:1282 stop:1701 length:420 start_codon:yes stop_codon:yes gene_type:complete